MTTICLSPPHTRLRYTGIMLSHFYIREPKLDHDANINPHLWNLVQSTKYRSWEFGHLHIRFPCGFWVIYIYTFEFSLTLAYISKLKTYFRGLQTIIICEREFVYNLRVYWYFLRSTLAMMVQACSTLDFLMIYGKAWWRTNIWKTHVTMRMECTLCWIYVNRYTQGWKKPNISGRCIGFLVLIFI